MFKHGRCLVSLSKLKRDSEGNQKLFYRVMKNLRNN